MIIIESVNVNTVHGRGYKPGRGGWSRTTFTNEVTSSGVLSKAVQYGCFKHGRFRSSGHLHGFEQYRHSKTFQECYSNCRFYLLKLSECLQRAGENIGKGSKIIALKSVPKTSSMCLL